MTQRFFINIGYHLASPNVNLDAYITIFHSACDFNDLDRRQRSGPKGQEVKVIYPFVNPNSQPLQTYKFMGTESLLTRITATDVSIAAIQKNQESMIAACA